MGNIVNMIARLVLLTFFSVGCVRGSCFKENITWLSTDIMDVVQPVAYPYLCQDLCAGTEECTAFTWTTNENPQFRSTCFIFSNTSNEISSAECISGPNSCTCSSEVACQGDEENILEIRPSVVTEGACQRICTETASCMYYTWHNANSFPSYTCILLSSCDESSVCSGCLSGPSECSSQLSSTCSFEISCQGDAENILEIIPGVVTEGACQKLCLESSSCGYYTWHDATSFPSYTCILLTSCDESSACSGCFSGPPECSSVEEGRGQ